MGPVIGPNRLRWRPVGRLVCDRNVGRTGFGARSCPAASGRLSADMLARLAGDATEALAELQPVPKPTPVEQAAGNDDPGAAS